jgi:hypothetical protein
LPRLLGSFAALACFPVYIVRGVPKLEVGVFGGCRPYPDCLFLSRTGRYERPCSPRYRSPVW